MLIIICLLGLNFLKLIPVYLLDFTPSDRCMAHHPQISALAED